MGFHPWALLFFFSTNALGKVSPKASIILQRQHSHLWLQPWPFCWGPSCVSCLWGWPHSLLRAQVASLDIVLNSSLPIHHPPKHTWTIHSVSSRCHWFILANIILCPNWDISFQHTASDWEHRDFSRVHIWMWQSSAENPHPGLPWPSAQSPDFVKANKGLHDGNHFPLWGKSPLSLHTRLNVLCWHFLFPLLRINTLSPPANSLLDLRCLLLAETSHLLGSFLCLFGTA